MADEPQAKGFNPMRPPQHDSHHQHHEHSLGRDELKLGKDFLAAYKKQLDNQTRMEAWLIEINDKLDVISISTEERAELEAFRSAALPAMVEAANQLNVFTPES